MTFLTTAWEWLHSQAPAIPYLAKFALVMVIIVAMPPLCNRIRLPAVVGLLLSGVLLGPHVLGIFGERAPIMDFFAQLGRLLLMFFAGLEIDIMQFRREQNKSILFGLVTTFVPLVLGTAVGFLFGYQAVAAVVIGSLLASHTLLGAPIIFRLGETNLEPVIITFGATVLSDTLSLIVFAICVPIYQSGFSIIGLVVQLIEIAIFVPVILFGLSRLGAYFLKKVEDNEDAYFALMLAIVAVAGLLAQIVSLPGIVGAFLAGLAVNAAVKDKPAKAKLEFFGNSFFIPIFFVVIGFLIEPVEFFQSITTDFALASMVVGALLLGKWVAAEIVGRTFGYALAARMTMWSLTLPQVAATLAATLVGFETVNSAGQRLLDSRLLNVVLVLLVTTSILGPVFTELFAPSVLSLN